MPTLQDIKTWRGRDVVDSDGDKIGTLEDILPRPPERRAGVGGHLRPAAVRTKVSFAPIRDASASDRHRGGYGPRVRHDRTRRRRPRDRRGDDALRGELRVGTTQRETGRARLRTYVVTDNVTQTVPVEREENSVAIANPAPRAGVSAFRGGLERKGVVRDVPYRAPGPRRDWPEVREPVRPLPDESVPACDFFAERPVRLCPACTIARQFRARPLCPDDTDDDRLRRAGGRHFPSAVPD
jgi:hypothetical protein